MKKKKPLAVLMTLCWLSIFGSRTVAWADETEDIEATIYSWRDAWRDKKVDQYISFHSPTFKSGGRGYAAWIKDKKRLLKKPVKYP